ncbi:hypothetical protein BDN72DRAFT_827867 [Pluteus cervinus]|uniref:Uncharacterized protein n=1 Tax=Pluteus cervinus TaxID=181527 RepID=A0ACD3A8M3_9AGAR|nr:hypothetical protein BDN72DRAFT_827867 [Pluteus cervinus]
MSVQTRPQFPLFPCLLLPQLILSIFVAYRFSLFWRTTALIALIANVTFALSCTTGDAFQDYTTGVPIATMFVTTIHLLFLTNPETDFKHESSTQPVQALSIPRRLIWGISITLNPRNVGWNTEVANLPPRPTTGRWRFVLDSLLRAAWLLFLLALAQLYFHTNPIFSLSGQAAVSVKSQGYLWRCINVFVAGAQAYGIMNLPYSLLCAFLVALGISEPKHCPNLFGSWADSYTVRRFWGRTWHQTMRRFMTSYGKCAARLLGFKPGTSGSSYIQLYVAFALSAVIHSVGDRMVGLEYTGCSAPFFMSQAIAITFEDMVIAVVRRRGVKIPPTVAHLVGYIWVFVWFSVSLPWFLDWFLRISYIQ